MRGLLVLAVACLTGCFTVSREYPEKVFYSLSLRAPAAERPDRETRPVLQVGRFHVSRAYEGRELVYRTSDEHWESDYYHAFFHGPATLIADTVRQRLERTGLFSHVVPAGSLVETPYRLEGVVNALYGDYRNPQSAMAVLHLQFFLVDDAPGASHLVLKRDFRGEEPIGSREPEDLVRGWNRALERAMKELEGALENVAWGVHHGATENTEG